MNLSNSQKKKDQQALQGRRKIVSISDNEIVRKPRHEIKDKLNEMRKKENQPLSDSQITSNQIPLNSNSPSQNPFQTISPLKSQLPKPYQPLSVPLTFEMIVSHLIKNLSIGSRSARLDYLLLQLRQGVPLKTVMPKFDKKDLALIAEHKKIIQTLENNFCKLVEKTEFDEFKQIDFQRIIIEAYQSLKIDINLPQLRNALLKVNSFQKPTLIGKVKPMVETLINFTKRDLQSSNIKIPQVDQYMDWNLDGKIVQKISSFDPFQQFNTQNQHQTSSKYGIFSNRKQEYEISKEGVFNYRIHRTMELIDKFHFLDPQRNLKIAKNLSIFLIKLTDYHMNNAIENTVKNAQVSSKFSCDQSIFDEVTYYTGEAYKQRHRGQRDQNVSPKFQICDEYSIYQLKYPSSMAIYKRLRFYELKQEQELYKNIGPELTAYLSKGKKRLNKDQKAIIEYYTKKPSTQKIIIKLNTDCDRQQSNTAKKQINRTPIDIKHLRHYLQNHPYYNNHNLLQRLRIVY